MPSRKAGAPLPPDFTSDIEKWISLFPLEAVPRGKLSGGTICCAQDLAITEQLRRRAFRASDPVVPADIFLFALGEPTRRDVTKVGGLPYRPKNAPWPTSERGQPMTFLAQFRFCESADMLPTLPGDILLVFVRDYSLGDDPKAYFTFEWQSLGLQTLVESADIPAPAWEFVTCYGVRIRTVDYHFTTLSMPAQRLQPLVGDRRDLISSASKVCWLDGMKIGGLPSWNALDDPNISVLRQHLFLGSLAGITPPFDSSYPWLNRVTPRSFPADAFKILDPKETLYLMDGFAMYFFLTSDNQVFGYHHLA